MLQNLLKKSKGSVIILFILFIPFMLAFIGLAIDFSYIYVEKTKLQNAADAAALAGVVHLQDVQSATKSSDKKPAKDYVKAMLKGNEFTPTGNDPNQNLSAQQNWKLNYLKKQKNAQNQDETIEVTDPTKANRLKVTLFKQIPLVFMPIIVPNLATIDLTSSAMAQGTLEGKKPSDEFQFIALELLRLGTEDDTIFGSVHIPSFPKGSSAKDLYEYKDFGESVTKNIYAKNIEFRPLSTLRSSSKVLVNDKGTMTTYIENNQLVMSDPNDLENISQSEKYNLLDINNIVSKTVTAGTKIANYYIDDAEAVTAENAEIIKENEKEPNKDKHKPLKKPKAIVVKVTGNVLNFNDYSFSKLREENKQFFDGPNIKDEGQDLTGLDINVPVIFYSASGTSFTVNFNVSWFCFKKELIVVGGNINISGSGTMSNPQYGTSSNTKYQKYSDIYCLAKNSTDASKGEFTVVSGSASVKDFSGIIYASRKVNIQAMKDYRRHIFGNTLISSGLIEFGRDKSSVNGKESACKFDSMPVSTKISLVE